MGFPEAIIFDIDDTLYPEVEYTLSGYRVVASSFAERLGAPFDLFTRMKALFDSPDRGRVFDVIAAEAGADDAALVGEMVDCFRSHAPSIALFADAEAALGELRGRCRLGAISDGYLVAQRAKATALGLFDRLDAVILTDGWGREFWKPHPRAFEEMATRLGVAHSACVYVGDNLAKDFVAPNALGWRTVYVDRPGGVHRGKVAPAGGEPQVVVGSLAGLGDGLG